MAELLEKLLLISFGLSILVIILPPTIMIIDNFQFDEKPEKIIESIISELNNLLDELPKYDFFNLTNNISFNGSIYVLIPSNNIKNVFILRFCPTGSHNVIYREISVSYNIEIQINSLLIKEYQILAISQVYYIIFR